MITIKFATADFDRKMAGWLRLAKNPRGILAAAGRALANELKRHFRKRHATNPNKLGGKRQNFWLQVMRGVQAPVVDSGARTARVSVNHPAIRQKLLGGTIVAKRARALTIPLSKEAYGRRASVLEHELGVKLFLIPRDFGEGLLAARMADGAFTVHYALRRSVTQERDPETLPADRDLVRPVEMAAYRALVRQLQGGAA